MKMLTNYLQVISLINILPAEWPGSVDATVDANQTVSIGTTTVLSLDCVYSSISKSLGIPKPFIKLLIINLIPAFYIIWAAFFWAIIHITRKIKGLPTDTINNLITTIVIICFGSQSMVIQANLQVFECDNIYRDDTPLYYMKSDLDIQCWEDEHKKWTFTIALPLVLFWAIIGPSLMFLHLKKNKEKLRVGGVKNLSFIYKGFKLDKYYWEFVVLLRKYFLIIVAIFGSFYTSFFQVYIAVYIILVTLFIQIKGDPYLNQKLNKLEQTGLICALILSLAGLYFHSVDMIPGLTHIVIIIAIGSNIYFILIWVKEFWISMKMKIALIVKRYFLKGDNFKRYALKYPKITKLLFTPEQLKILIGEKKEEPKPVIELEDIIKIHDDNTQVIQINDGK